MINAAHHHSLVAGVCYQRHKKRRLPYLMRGRAPRRFPPPWSVEELERLFFRWSRRHSTAPMSHALLIQIKSSRPSTAS